MRPSCVMAMSLVWMVLVLSLLMNNENGGSVEANKSSDKGGLGIEKSTLQAASDFFWKQQALSSSLLEMLRSKETLKTLTKLTNAMVLAGPALMVVSTGLALLSLFGDQPESAELVEIKAGFARVEAGISNLKFQLDEVSFLITYKAAQTAYQKEANSIYNLHDEMVRPNRNAKDNERFVKTFDSTYNYAAKNLWRYMVSEDSIDINLLDAYREFSKCNTYKIQGFCLRLVDRITKGQLVEGHYFALTNDTAGLLKSKEEWVARMATLEKRCQQVVKTCSDQWEKYGQDELNRVYNDFFTSSKEVLAEKLHAGLTATVPQRIWFVWVYQNAIGFGEHTIASTETFLKRWHENNLVVTAASVDEEHEPLSKSAGNALMEELTKKASQHQRDFQDKTSVSKNLAVFMYKSTPRNIAAVYAIQPDKNPVYRGDLNRTLAASFNPPVVRWPLKVYLVQ